MPLPLICYGKPYQDLTDQYRNITKATKTIWYDNGVINRFNPEHTEMLLFGSWLFRLSKSYLSSIDDDLNNKDLELICCGEESKLKNYISNQTYEFLVKVFDENYRVEVFKSLQFIKDNKNLEPLGSDAAYNDGLASIVELSMPSDLVERFMSGELEAY